MRPSEPPCEVNISVSIKEVKRNDFVVQDTMGLTMIDGTKKEIPFLEDVKYKFDSLMKNFVFKYAILQQGVLYLEIPFKYKFTKKFKVGMGVLNLKIEDWYPLKPFDGRPSSQIDNSLVARVVISYDSNCKLDPTFSEKFEHIEDLKGTAVLTSEVHPNSAQKDYKTELRKIRRTTTADKENNLNYLEEVERNIMNRRKRNIDSAGYSSVGRTGSTDSTRLLRSSSKTSTGLRGPLSRALTSRKKIPGAGTAEHNSITPDDMYRTAGSMTARAGGPDDKMVAKMSAELTANKQEIKDLRDKLKALQEGQMTVDNLQLSKRLDEERAQLNAERNKMLKEYAALKDEADSLKKKAIEQRQRSEEELIKQKQELEDKRRMLDLDMKQLAMADDELRSIHIWVGIVRRNIQLPLGPATYKCEKTDPSRTVSGKLRSGQEALSRREDELLLKEEKTAAKWAEVEKAKQDMLEYQLELNELKDKMMQERERILGDKSRFVSEKEDLERDIKSLKSVKENLEREREREMKEVLKKKREVDAAEERVNRDKQSLEHDLEKVANEKAKLEEEVKKHKALNEELEEEKLKCWRDRNALNLEVKQFLEDRKKMESDLKWRIKEVEQTQDTLNKELKEINKDKDDLNEYQDKLEEMKNDLESRERLLLHEREDFAKLKLKFIDGLLESGGLSYLTPELKQMAHEYISCWEEKDLGIGETAAQKPTLGSKWGNSIQPAEVKIEKEYFPSIGDTYEEGGKSKEKEPTKISATTENQVISEKKPKANSLFAGMTSGTPAPAPTAAVAAPVEETGPIKFKNAKAKGSLLQMIDETKPVEVVAKPVEEDGAAPMKFKGKLKVDYKETSTERKQREAEEEARKQSTGLVFGSTPKPVEAKPQLAKPGLAAESISANHFGLDVRGAGFGAAKPEAKPMGRGTLPTREGKEDDGWNRA